MENIINNDLTSFFIKILTKKVKISLFEISDIQNLDLINKDVDFLVIKKILSDDFFYKIKNSNQILFFELIENDNNIKNLDEFIKENNFKVWYKTEYENKTLIITSKKDPKEFNDKIKPIISVCIPTGKRKDVLFKALDAWNNSENIHTDLIELVIVENGSSEIETEELLKYKTPIKYENIKEAHLSFARSITVNKATADILFLTNDDTIATSNLLEMHLNYQSLYYKNKLAILGKFIFHPEVITTKFMQVLENGKKFFYQNDYDDFTLYKTDLSFLTNNISILKHAVIEAGNFSKDFPRAASDDLDLGYQLDKLGYHVLFKSDLVSYHYHFYTLEDFVNSTINRAYWAIKYVKKYPSTEKRHFIDGINGEGMHRNFYLNSAFSHLIKNYTFDDINDNLNYVVIYILNMYSVSFGVLKGANEFLNYKMDENAEIKEKPLISILLLVDENDDVEKSIQSVINQSYENWELILISNENNTVLPQIIEKYSNIKQKISINNTENKIKTIKNIEGKYIKFLLSNEILISYALEFFVRYLIFSNEAKKIFYGDYMIFNKDENKYFGAETTVGQFLFNKNSDDLKFVPISSSFLEKEILLNTFKFIDFEPPEFHDFLNKALLKYEKEKIELPFFISYPQKIKDNFISEKEYKDIICNVNNLISEKNYQSAITELTKCIRYGFKNKEVLKLMSRCIELSGDLETLKKIVNNLN